MATAVSPLKHKRRPAACESAAGGPKDCLWIDDSEDAAGKGDRDAPAERGYRGALLQEVVGIAPDAGGREVAQGLGGDESGDGVADGCDGGYASVFHCLADSVEVVAGIVDVAQIDGVLEGYEAAIGLAEPAAQGVERAAMGPESHLEDVAGGKRLVGDAEQQETSAELEDRAERIIGSPGGGAAGGDDGLGVETNGAEAVREVTAALLAGAAADFVGDGSHVRRGVARVKDEVGVESGFEVEGRADEGARGPQDVEEGVDDRGCATHDEAEAAEGTVNHEEVASLHAEAAQVGGESVAGEDHA